MYKLKLIVLICLFFLLGCSTKNNSNPVNNIYILHQGVPTTISTVSGQQVKEFNIGKQIEQIVVDTKYIYGISSGSFEKPEEKLFIINKNENRIENEIKLSYSPQFLIITEGKAFIASSVLDKNQGNPVIVVDLKTKKEIRKFYLKGKVTSVTKDSKFVYFSVSSGGKNNFGQFSNIVKINSNNYETSNILKVEQEIPPGFMAFAPNGKLYGVYAGFSKGPKPRWVSKPEDYTNKIKIIDVNTGLIEKEITTDQDYPQSIVFDQKGIGYINHYCDLDISGDSVSVLNSNTNKIEGSIGNVNTPRSIWLNKNELFVVNYTEGAISIININNKKIDKKIKIKENPLTATGNI